MSERERDRGAGTPRRWLMAALLIAAPAAVWVASGESEEDPGLHNLLQPFVDPTGVVKTFSTSGRVDTNNPFFQSLGTNGRACITCHQPSTGWTVTPEQVQRRFDATDGLDPIFRTNDGSNSPWADVSTVDARRSAYSMLLSKGLIRVGIGIPKAAEFTLDSVDDPYGYASANELSLFRRPLPSTNLSFLSTVMFDGRETFKGQSIDFDLMHQANSATVGHAQASIQLSDEQRREILEFETSLFTAQIYDRAAGELNADGATGGPRFLSTQDFYLGINDPLGLNPKGVVFSPVIFTDFDAWLRFSDDGAEPGERGRNAARAAVARGEQLFNSRRVDIVGVKGLNDVLGMQTIHGFCSTCHD